MLETRGGAGDEYSSGIALPRSFHTRRRGAACAFGKEAPAFFFHVFNLSILIIWNMGGISRAACVSTPRRDTQRELETKALAEMMSMVISRFRVETMTNAKLTNARHVRLTGEHWTFIRPVNHTRPAGRGAYTLDINALVARTHILSRVQRATPSNLTFSAGCER